MDGFEDEEEKQDEILWNDEVIIDTDFLILPDDLVLEPRHFRLAWNYGRQGEGELFFCCAFLQWTYF